MHSAQSPEGGLHAADVIVDRRGRTRVTVTTILEALAKEFSIKQEEVQNVLEMIDAGLSAPFIGRFRRGRTGALSESMVRRLESLRQEFDELDRRRGTILRTLERDSLGDEVLEPIRTRMDRFEIEDLFVPHRRPEPEVQLALDRGLGALADLLVKPVPRSDRKTEKKPAAPKDEGVPTDAAATDATPAEPTTTEGAPSETPAVAPEAAEAPATETPAAEAEAAAPEAAAPEAAAPEAAAPEAAAPEAAAPEAAAPEAAAPEAAAPEAAAPEAAAPEAAAPEAAAPEAAAPEAAAPEAAAPEAAAPEAAAPEAAAPEAAAPEAAAPEAAAPKAAAPKAAAPKAAAPAGPKLDVAGIAGLPVRVAMTPELARLCEPFVSPDKGVHTESEALAGAVRILSDRLGRNSHLRGLVRNLMRKRGTLTVRPLVEASKAGRHKPLLKLKQALSQIQGHRLLAVRQAQKERVLTTAIQFDPEIGFTKVRNVLGKHTHEAYKDLLDEIARKSLEVRLMPVVEADVRLQLKERGDSEALRFLSQHLRQLLLTPVFGPHACAGIDVSAKGDWIVALVDGSGTLVRATKIERGEKDAAALGAELAAALEGGGARAIAIGHGKGPRSAATMLRAAVAASGLGATVTIVNEAGLSNYANSDIARKELGDQTVQERAAISLARRLQDPMAEILKVEPRHLGLGAEQGLVSKANAKRVFTETIESCVAHVGCNLETSPLSVLQHVPGLDKAAAKKLIERREQGPIPNREQLRAEGILTEAQWTSAIAFLRLPNSDEPLDATSLHPELYDLTRKLLESTGGSVEDSLGRPGASKGLRRTNFDVDSATWRDLMRELAQPGRDPRFSLRRPTLLEAATDTARLVKDRVVDGIVTNVASFGVFVDIGLPQDAMIHISEISDRYLRDARELLSIGEVVRAKILGMNGSRVALSLNRVPPPERAPRPEKRPNRGEGGRDRQDGRGGGRGGGGGRGRREERPRENPNLRAAQSRRDGIGGASARGGGRGGPGGGRGPGRQGGGRGRREDDRMGRDERVSLDKINANTKDAAFSPFAKFFKGDEKDESKEQAKE